MPIHEVIALLEGRLRRGLGHYRARLLLAGAVRAAAVVAAVSLLTVAAAAIALDAAAPRMLPALAAGGALTLVAALARFLVLPWMRRPDLRRFARLAEEKLPGLRSLLVNALELAPVVSGRRAAPGATSRDLAAALLVQAEERSRDSDFRSLAPRTATRAWWAALLGVLVLWGIGVAIAPGPLSSAAYALVHPGAAVAAGVRLSVWPGTVTLASGSKLHVGARVRGPHDVPVLVWTSGAETRRVPMTAGLPPADADTPGTTDPGDGEGVAYRAAIEAVSAAGEYHVETGPVKSQRFRVTLGGDAAPVSFEVTYRYPAYTRLPEETQAATRADLTALEGTRARVRLHLDRRAESVGGTLGSAWREDGGRAWVGETTIQGSRPYEITVRAGGVERTMSYRIEAIPDRAPLLTVVEPRGDLDLPAGQRITIAVSAADDFGLRDLTLVYERSAEEGGAPHTGRLALAGWNGEPREATAHASWDLSPLALLPGQSVGFHLELRDNDSFGGPNVTRSPRFVVRFPNLSEVYKDLDERQEAAEAQLERMLEQAKEVARQADEAQRQAQQSRDPGGEASFEKRQQAKDLAERQQEIVEQLRQVSDAVEQASRDAAERSAYREELVAKMQEIARLMQELESPQLKEAIQRLQESLSQVDPRRLEANLRQLERAQQELLKGLERTLELLRRARAEEKLQSAARRAEELARREEALERRAEESGDAERQAAAQEQAERDAESLRQDVEQLEKELRAEQRDEAAQKTQAGEQTLEQEAQPAMKQSAQQMRSGQRQQAKQSARRASQAMKEVAQQLDEASRSLEDESQRQIADAVRRSAQDLVDLSQRQEQALSEAGDSGERARRQQDLREGAERIVEDLMTVGKQTPFLPPEAQRAVGQGLERLRQSADAFQQGGEREGEQLGRAASSAFNQAVIELRDAEQSMCQGGQKPGGQGQQQTRAQMEMLSGQQGELNRDSQSLTERLTQQQRMLAGDPNATEHLAARQEAIRRGLEDVMSQREEGELLGRLDQAQQEMEEVERQLRQGRLNDALIDRQNQILSRLLDAQRSVNRREFDERRESRAGETIAREAPSELPSAVFERAPRAERDLLRARSERYPPEYRDLVDSYLRRLQETP
jgi:hypothetical protein